MFNCFDALKNPIPCPVVTVPEPWAWEIAVVGLVIALLWGWKTWREKRP